MQFVAEGVSAEAGSLMMHKTDQLIATGQAHPYRGEREVDRGVGVEGGRGGVVGGAQKGVEGRRFVAQSCGGSTSTPCSAGVKRLRGVNARLGSGA